ncbi:MAG: dethiobiotin synthase [Polyangia bacterium]
MARVLFVTGTDTGVGKTAVSAALLAAWRELGRPVTPLKPLETGCAPERPGEDAARLAAAAGTDPADAGLLRFAEPLCPEAAARAAGQRPMDRAARAALLAACRARATSPTLIEGAGGLLVPIGPGYTMADLATDLAADPGASVLVVARTRLGTLNHTLLTLRECRRRGLRVLAVVLNRTDPTIGPEERDNAELLRVHGDVEVLGPLPFLPAPPATGQITTEQLAAAALQTLPVAWLHDLAFGAGSR